MEKINVAVIGVGSMGRNHARVFSLIPGANLTAVCDIDKKLVKEIGKMYSVKWYTDYKRMFTKEEMDAVSIAVPTSKHEEVALYALNCGKHILIEKPIAHNLESAQRIVESANNANLKLMVGHIERFNPVVAKVKQLVNEGELGQIVSFSAKRVGPFARRISGVGVCLDLAIHDIDVIRFITNDEVCEVYAMTGSNFCPYEDYASILLTLRGGATGLIEVNWLTPTKIRRLDVTGLQGYATLDYINQEICLFGKMLSKNYLTYEELVMAYGCPQMARIKIEQEEPLKLELRHFIDSIINDNLPLVDGETGIKNLKVALAAVQSARERRCITLRG